MWVGFAFRYPLIKVEIKSERMKCYGNLFIKMLFPVQPILAAYCGKPCVEVAVETCYKGARRGIVCLRSPENLSHEPQPQHKNITNPTPAFSQTLAHLYMTLLLLN